MKKHIIFLAAAILLAAAPLFSQNKGASPLSGPSAVNRPPSAVTRAVVIGISDYQDKDIPDLRFADKDAEAFANFLRSPAGGSLDKDHLQVLTNQNATAGQVAAALDWLLEQSKEGDEAIIYFSGHGDVERKTISQPGFLLCWDSPARVYMGGGTYSLAFLQEIVSTLSTQNKVKVVVVTDACHAGKLAGSQIGGAQATTANLAKQFANEVKILSCQPNEFSLEGEQWGGGRGIFSYHLVDGLFGLADRNGDGMVSVGEIDRYLEDHVTAEAAPQSQVPMLLGNKTERLALVDTGLLAALRSDKVGQLETLSPFESKGMEGEVLTAVDTSIRELYFTFKKSLKDKMFLEPANACADSYYKRLIAEPKLERLYSAMRRNYAAALQDDAQQAMNKTLKTDMSEYNLSRKTKAEKYKNYPRYLERAAQLLGPQHYMYPALQARKHFFQGYVQHLSNLDPGEELRENTLVYFRQTLRWQPGLPHAHWLMSEVYGYNLQQLDSMEYYALRAAELAPSWVLPYYHMGQLFASEGQFDVARKYLEMASKIDSTSPVVCNVWGYYFKYKGQYTEAEQQYKKAIQLDSNYTHAYNNLGNLLDDMNRTPEAEQLFKHAIQMDSTYAAPHLNLGIIFNGAERYKEAEYHYQKAIQKDPSLYMAHRAIGHLYEKTGRFAEAEQSLKNLIQLDSANFTAYEWLGEFYLDQRRFAEAEQLFKNYIRLDSTTLDAHNSLGIVYFESKRYIEAEQEFRKAIQLDSSDVVAYKMLGDLNSDNNNKDRADKYYQKAFQLDSNFIHAYFYKGNNYLSKQRYAEAEKQYQQLILLDPTYNNAYYNLACLYSLQKQVSKACEYLEKSFDTGWDDYDWLLKDTDLNILREQAEQWKALLKKHFPDQYKD